MAHIAMRKYFMNPTQQIYEELCNGLVRVTNSNGGSGVFHYDGRWIEGEVRDANVNMLVWTGGPSMPEPFRYRWGLLPADPERPSGWPEVHERYLRAQGTQQLGM